MGKVLNVLVLAGTADARFVIESLSDNDNLSMIASLAGATDAPLPLPVKVRTGGFGGPDGMAEYCSEHAIDVILDITHPFARQISHNAEIAADMVGLPCLAFDRPPWVIGKGGREFDSWQEMVDALTPGEHVFLAGGTASVEVFSKRADVFLCARALNVMNDDSIANRVFINAMPSWIRRGTKDK